MLFWKAQPEPFAEAQSAKRQMPIFLTMLLAGALFYGFSEGFIALYSLLFDTLQSLAKEGKIRGDLPVLFDFMPILCNISMLLPAGIGMLYVRFLEGRSLSSMNFHKSGMVSALCKGLLLGLVLFGAILAALFFMDKATFAEAEKTDFLARAVGILSLIGCGVGFELYFRGFVLSSLGARSRTLVAVLLTAILSTAAHCHFWGYNISSILSNFVLNCLLGILAARTGSAYSACALRTMLLFLSQFVFGIKYATASYAHALFPVTVTFDSSWTGKVGSIDFGYLFLAAAAILLVLAVFLPKKVDDDVYETGPFIKHVPVEKKSEPAPAATPVKKAPEAAPVQHVLRRSTTLQSADVAAAASSDDDDEWEEEVGRVHVEPDYKKPEEYLK